MLEADLAFQKRQSFTFFLEIEKEKAKHPQARADTKILVPGQSGANETTFGARMTALNQLKRDADAAARRLQELLDALPEAETTSEVE